MSVSSVFLPRVLLNCITLQRHKRNCCIEFKKKYGLGKHDRLAEIAEIELTLFLLQIGVNVSLKEKHEKLLLWPIRNFITVILMKAFYWFLLFQVTSAKRRTSHQARCTLHP